MKRLFFVLLVIVGVLAVAGVLFVRKEIYLPNAADGMVVQIPLGTGARGVVDLLGEKKLIRNRYAALAYIAYTRTYNKLQAGEYVFEPNTTIHEIVRKLSSGDVYLHKFTVPEGLTVKQTAMKWEEQGFGKAEDFTRAAAEAVDLVHRLNDKALTVEGYLFPETYSFPLGTTAKQAVTAMIGRFQEKLEQLKQTVPPSNWPRNLHDTIIVASLVESEAAVPEERPLIASVYLNRLGKKILLQCDPTVIYALDLADRYRGTLTLADLRFDSPYNTYVKPGLPPGPITNPGYASLLAAVQPSTSNYIFFVRTVDGRHTFSETLSAHNRAVAAYRKLVREARRNNNTKITR
jgi:UPF0755 protein